MTRKEDAVIKRTLKSIRADLKLDQADMAKLLGLSLAGYQKKERGETPLLARELLIIAEVSKVPIGDIEVLK